MQDLPLVSFVVLSFQQEDYIRDAVKAALSQTYRPLEIIISDDASTDRSFEYASSLVAQYSGPHRVIMNRNHTNIGIIGHLNRIMEIVSGDLIVIAAGDDISLPWRTSVLVGAWLSGGRRAHCLHSSAVVMSSIGVDLRLRFPADAIRYDPSPADIVLKELHTIGATAAWTPLVFSKFLPMDERAVAEDSIIPLRASLLGGVQYIDQPLVRYREGGISADFKWANGKELLFGTALKWLRRHSVVQKQWQEDLHGYPEFDSIADVIQGRIDRSEFTLALAGSSYLRRLPLSLSHLRYWRISLKYLFPSAYVLYLNSKQRPADSASPTR